MAEPKRPEVTGTEARKKKKLDSVNSNKKVEKKKKRMYNDRLIKKDNFDIFY